MRLARRCSRTIWAAPHLRAGRPCWSESGWPGRRQRPRRRRAGHRGSERRVYVGVALGQDAECRLSASRLGTVIAIEAIVRQDDRRSLNGAIGGGRPLLLREAFMWRWVVNVPWLLRIDVLHM
jgi:hypothetical protein